MAARARAFPTLRLLLCAAGVVGGALLIAADLSTLYQVKVITVVERTRSGHAQHDWALLVLGVAAIAMSVAAAAGSRPATVALLALGVTALIVGPLGDSHDVHSAGVVANLFEDATAAPRSGYRLETVGAILVLAAGACLLALALPWTARGRRASDDGGAAAGAGGASYQR
jgi:hypothetical protein